MTVKQNKTSFQDASLWCLVAFCVAGGLYANHHYASIDVSIRALAFLAILALTLAVAYQTQKGRDFVKFAKESKNELRKVVWPTRDEAVKNTIMVAIIVAIMSLFLWGVDALVAWGISHFVR